MRYAYILLIASVVLLALAMPVNSRLSCEVAAACGYTTMFRISDPSNGHAELANESNYNNLVCCRELEDYSLGTGCSGNYATLLKLLTNSDSHAEEYNESNYNISVCMNTTMSGLTVAYAPSCASYDTCVASISNNINAHVGNCTAYSTKVCITTENLHVTLNLNTSRVFPNELVQIYGNVTDRNGAGISNATISIYLNGTLLTTDDLISAPTGYAFSDGYHVAVKNMDQLGRNGSGSGYNVKIGSETVAKNGSGSGYNVALGYLRTLNNTNKTLMTNANGTYNYTIMAPSSDGLYEIKVNVTYNAVSGQNTTILNVTHDQTPPAVALLAPDNMTYNSTNVTLSFLASDTQSLIVYCGYELNGNANVTLFSTGRNTTSINTTFIANNGSNTMNVFCTDERGNTGNATLVNFTVDLIAPQISFVSPTNPNILMSDRNYTYVNVSVGNASSAFINWNNSLVGWWSFDNNTLDQSSYGNNGTQVGGVDCSKATAGKISTACSFDGTDDYVNVSNSASLNITRALTIEAWFKTNDKTVNQQIIRKENGTGAESYELYIGSTIYFCVRGSSEICSQFSNSLISNGNWYHIAGTYDGSSTKFYLNGVQQDSDSGTVTITSSNEPVYIGWGGSGAATRYFNGTIDEVQIWKRALSAQEINASYNASAYRLERNFTNLNDGLYNYYAVAIDAGGNRNTTETRNVTVRLITPLITNGNNSVVGTENYQSSNLTVTFYQPSTNTYANNVNGRIWIETNAGVFDEGHSCVSNAYGNCSVEFLPTCDYTSGVRRFRGGVFDDDLYNFTNSTDGFLTIDTTAYCINKVSFSLEFNMSDSQNDHAEVDNRTPGLYRPHQLANYYACIEDTSLSNSPAFGLVFSGRTLNYINLTAGNSYMMKMSQHQAGNKFIIPITRDGCTAIRNKMNIVQAFGVMTQPFYSSGTTTGSPIEVALSYPDIDIIGNISKSGTFIVNIEKNESNGVLQLVFRD